MASGSEAVDRYLAALTHPRKAEIEALRAVIVGCHPEITERVKWNAPSFCHRGDDRVTMRLHPGARVQLVFHRGAKVKADDDFCFTDASGLLEWAARDRAVVTFADAAAVAAQSDTLAALVRAWVERTGEG